MNFDFSVRPESAVVGPPARAHETSPPLEIVRERSGARIQRRSSADLNAVKSRCGQIIQASIRLRRRSQATAILSTRWPSTGTQRRSSADLMTRLLRCGQIIQASIRIRRRSQATAILSWRWPTMKMVLYFEIL